MGGGGVNVLERPPRNPEGTDPRVVRPSGNRNRFFSELPVTAGKKKTKNLGALLALAFRLGWSWSWS